MEITFWNELIVAIVIAAIIGSIAGLVVKRCNDSKVGIGCGLMFPITLITLIGFKFLLPDVTIINEENGVLSHSESEYLKSYSLPNGDTFPLSLKKSYIANTTDELLVLYPAYYGLDTSKAPEEEKPIFIAPNTVVCIKNRPDKFFEAPDNQISTKSSSIEVRWILEPLRKIVEREGTSMDEIGY